MTTNLTGQSIGRYHILEQLGKGGMAIVYKAFDMQLEQEVAIKFIRMEAWQEEDQQITLKRFKREARLLAKLSHPNILTLLDYGQHEGLFYLVTNYVSGSSLDKRLGQAMPWPEAVHLLMPIVRALEFAHSHHILHRDIKPSNILLSSDGTPILADFGLAKVLESQSTSRTSQLTQPDVDQSTESDFGKLTRSDVGLGTPEYMSPEQGRGKADERSDIYSLGVVFFEMVTGRRPYIADTPLAVLLMHITDPLPSPRQFVPDLPLEIERIIIKALEKDPDNRYQNVGTFAEAITQVAAQREKKLRVQATELEQREKWEEARNAWREVLEFAPADHAVIEAEMKRLEQKREIKELYNSASQAVTENDYPRATQLLKEILGKDGSYKPASTLLAQTIKMRQAWAAGLEKEEKWEEALKAWREYLALEPENQKVIEDQIQRIEFKRELANSYHEARRAMNERDYALAIRLLKDIVARDETYKDVLQLLARAIEKRQAAQRAIGRRLIWAIPSVLLAAGCIYGAIVFSSNPEFRSRVAAVAEVITGATPTGTPPATEMVQAAPEGTPIPPAPSRQDIQAFAEPFLAAIANQPPAYQDDFSNPRSGWAVDRNSSGNEYGYQDGAYLISSWRAKRTDGESCTGVELPSQAQFSDFVLEEDVKFLNQNPGSGNVLFRSNDMFHYAANLSPFGKFWFHMNLNGNHVPLPLTETSIPVFQTGMANHLTLIAWQRQMAAYVNGEPVNMFIDSSSTQGRLYFGVCDGSPLQMLIDNLKVWDISGISVETSTGVIRSYADPRLAKVKGLAPTYQDDFSDSSSGWPIQPTSNGTQYGYQDGAYFISLTSRYRNAIGDSCLDISPTFRPTFSDFIMQVEAQFTSDHPGSLHVIFRQSPPSRKSSIFTSYFMGFDPDGTFFLNKNLDTNQVDIVNRPAAWLLSGTGKNDLSLIAQGSRMAVYANGLPLVLVDDQNWQAGEFIMMLGACTDSEAPIQVRFDNLKVWDITNLKP